MEKTETEPQHADKVRAYYQGGWNQKMQERIESGEASLAIHYGYFPDGDGDYTANDHELAKRRLNDFLFEQFDFDPNDHEERLLVDCGCGVGGTAMYIAENHDNLKIIGLNISHEQIAMARELQDSRGLSERLEFRDEDYADTSLEDESADCVYCVESLCHATDKAAFYREAYRVLKPGGKLVILDYFLIEDQLTEEDEEILQGFMRNWAIPGCHEDYETKMEQVGLLNIEFRNIYKNMRPGIQRSAKRARALLEEGGDKIEPSLRGHYKGCVAIGDLMEKGVLRYGVVTAFKKE